MLFVITIFLSSSRLLAPSDFKMPIYFLFYIWSSNAHKFSIWHAAILNPRKDVTYTEFPDISLHFPLHRYSLLPLPVAQPFFFFTRNLVGITHWFPSPTTCAYGWFRKDKGGWKGIQGPKSGGILEFRNLQHPWHISPWLHCSFRHWLGCYYKSIVPPAILLLHCLK
jgi:hypothetical protein